MLNVTAYKDMKDDETNSAEGLVIEAMAASFFEKHWVKRRLAHSRDLMVVTSSPLTVMDKGVC